MKRGDLKYEVGKYIFHFEQHEMIRSFGESIYTGKINIDEAETDQTNLLENIITFNNKSRQRSNQDEVKKTFNSVRALYEGRELTFHAFRSGIFPTKKKHKEKDLYVC